MCTGREDQLYQAHFERSAGGIVVDEADSDSIPMVSLISKSLAGYACSNGFSDSYSMVEPLGGCIGTGDRA